MNQRITELMIEAGKTMSGDKHIDADFCQKFAELIVKECAQLVDDHDPTGIIEGIVLQHFGVE